MVTVVIAGIAIISIYSAYEAQQRSHTAQQQTTEMQQNQRVALDNLARNLRMAGYNPQESLDTFRLRDISQDAAGNGYIQFNADIDEDGILDSDNETITYLLYQYPASTAADQDGILDLARHTTSQGRRLVAESIEYMEFAYAYDADGNGEIDLSPNNHILWAIDSDDDNDLDARLDWDDDGDIDIVDRNNPLVALGSDVDITAIRAVRIWLLSRAKHPSPNYYDGNATYVIGGRRFNPPPSQENVRRRLLDYTLYLRNI